MPDVFLLRHSHVDYTPPTPITAHNPLTPLGIVMADRLAERCEGWGIECLFASTMLRAKQTADRIAARLPDVPRIDMPELEETSIADLAGYPGVCPGEDLTSWDETHFQYARIPMGRRIRTGWGQIVSCVEEHGYQRVALVSHGAAMNHLIQHLLGIDDPPLSDCWIEFEWTATSCYRYGDGGRWLRWINDYSHVADLVAELDQ